MNETAADEIAIQRVLAGDSSAYDHLVNRYQRLVYVICLSRLGQVEAAEDLAQEVFLRAFLNLSKLKNPASFGPWVAQMSRNLGANWLRSNTRSSRLLPMIDLEEDDMQDIPDTRPSPKEELQDRERGRMVQDAIMRLAPSERETMLLHYMEGRTKKEIATHLGVHPSSVGRSLERGMEQLRGMMEEAVWGAVRAMQPAPAISRRTMRYISAAALLTGPAKEALAGAAATTASAGTANSGAYSSGTLLLFWQKALALLTPGGLGAGAPKAFAVVSAIAAIGIGTYAYNLRSSSRVRLIPSDAVIRSSQAGGDAEQVTIPTIYDGSIRGWRVRSFNQVQRNRVWVDDGTTMTTRVDVLRADPVAGATVLFTIEEFGLPENHANGKLTGVLKGYQFHGDSLPGGSIFRTRPVSRTVVTPEMSKYIGHSLRADVTSIISQARWSTGEVKEDTVKVEIPGFEDASMNVESTSSYKGRVLADGDEVLLIVSDLRGGLEKPFIMNSLQSGDTRTDVKLNHFDFTGIATYFLDPGTGHIIAVDYTISTTNISARLLLTEPGKAPVDQLLPVPDEATREVIRVEYF